MRWLATSGVRYGLVQSRHGWLFKTNPHLLLPHLTTETLIPRLKKDISQPLPGLVERPRATPPPPHPSTSMWRCGAL